MANQKISLSIASTATSAALMIAAISASTTALAAEPEVTADQLPRVPATEPKDAPGTFQIKEGFALELAASEPLIADPIALSFDELGRMYVVEMRDYSERRDERLGRISLLEDADGDGRMDKATVFAQGLPWPTGVICYDGGVFVISTPDILYLKDTDGDGKADVKKVVFTGLGSQASRLNVQQLANSMNWTLDNRIQLASGGNGGVITCPEHPEHGSLELRNNDFSFDPKTLEMRLESGGGQYGLSFDDAGHKFVCSNSSHIRQVMYEHRYLSPLINYQLPPPAIDIPVDGPAAEVFRISPEEPWRVLRTKWRVSGLVPGPIEGGGRSSGYFTGATGLTIYRGNAMGEDCAGDAFIGDAGSNLVHRKKLVPNGVPFKAVRPDDEQTREFLASRDNWFRPVQMANGPDGALYVIDMYREVIEHPWSLPPNMKKLLDLNSGNDRGRIYRVTAKNSKPQARPKFASDDDLVLGLTSDNGWTRDTALRLVYERGSTNLAGSIRKTLGGEVSAGAQIHLLHALSALKSLTPEDVLIGLRGSSPDVRENALKLCETIPIAKEVALQWETMANDESPRVRAQLAWTLSWLKPNNTGRILVELVKNNPEGWEEHAVLAVISQYPAAFLKLSPTGPARILAQACYLAGVRSKPRDMSTVLTFITNLGDPSDAVACGAAYIRGLRQGSAVIPKPVLGGLKPQIAFARDNLGSASGGFLSDAIVLVQAGNPGGDMEAVLELLSPARTQEVHSEVIQTIARDYPAALPQVLGRWAQLTPRDRTELLALALARNQFHPALLRAIEKGDIRKNELGATDKARLKGNKSSEVQELLQKIYGTEENTGSRADVIKAFAPALQLKGDATRGKGIFTERCSICHRLNGVGSAVGPDLESVRTSGKEVLLTNILDPNREVPPRFATYTVTNSQGEEITGILANEAPAGYTLRASSGQDTFIPRNQVTKLQTGGSSLMPEGLEAGLDAQAMADLLAFILSE